MTPETQKLIDLLESQIGYSEKGGYTKFGDWYGKNIEFDADYTSAPWCDMYLSWAAHKLGYQDWVGQFAWTVAHAEWFKEQGAWGKTPKPGAFVFYDWSGTNEIDNIDHVGFVTKVQGDKIFTIEGNIDGGLAKRKERDTSKVVGYGYPEQIKARLDKEAAQKQADEQAAMPARPGTDVGTLQLPDDALSSLIPHVDQSRSAPAPKTTTKKSTKTTTPPTSKSSPSPAAAPAPTTTSAAGKSAAKKSKNTKSATDGTTAATTKPLPTLMGASTSSPMPTIASPALVGSALVAALALLAIAKTRHLRLRPTPATSASASGMASGTGTGTGSGTGGSGRGSHSATHSGRGSHAARSTNSGRPVRRRRRRNAEPRSKPLRTSPFLDPIEPTPTFEPATTSTFTPFTTQTPSRPPLDTPAFTPAFDTSFDTALFTPAFDTGSLEPISIPPSTSPFNAFAPISRVGAESHAGTSLSAGARSHEGTALSAGAGSHGNPAHSADAGSQRGTAPSAGAGSHGGTAPSAGAASQRGTAFGAGAGSHGAAAHGAGAGVSAGARAGGAWAAESSGVAATYRGRRRRSEQRAEEYPPLPANSPALPTKPQALPTGQQAFPTKPQALPTERQALPTEPQALPAEPPLRGRRHRRPASAPPNPWSLHPSAGTLEPFTQDTPLRGRRHRAATPPAWEDERRLVGASERGHRPA